MSYSNDPSAFAQGRGGRRQSGVGVIPIEARSERRPTLGPFDSIDILPERLHDLSATNPHYVYASPRASLAVENGGGKKQGHGEYTDAGGKDSQGGGEGGSFSAVGRVQEAIHSFCENNKKWIRIGILLIVLVLYHVWLVLALMRDFNRAYNMLGTTVVVWVFIFYYHLFKPSSVAKSLGKGLGRLRRGINCSPGGRPIGKIVFGVVVAGLIAAFLIWDTIGARYRLTGLAGMALFVAIMWLFSTNPAQVNWRPVLVGLLLQFLVGMAVLRWDYGARKFNELADLIIVFLDFTKVGTNFVYGFLSTPPNICGMTPVLAFSVVQVVIYFGAVVALLYYYGVIQFVLKKMAWMMQLTMGTTACESLYACSCMFLGLAEAPLLIRPYLERMTASEIHAMMTTGFSTIAGALFATYISFGACPRYLLSACIMSAPGSLVCAKLLYPECEKSDLGRVEDLELPEGEESTPLEAISNGAVAAVEITLAIFANLVAFLGLLSLINAVILYFGHLIGMEGWSLQLFLGILLYPVVYLMGVTASPVETMNVAGLLGTKVVLNEFISYNQLGQLVAAGQLSSRSAMIATYALCSFSNFGAVGVTLGTIGSMMPKRKSLLAKIAIRSLCAGAISCLLTAALAGVLVDQPILCKPLTSSMGSCFDLVKGSQVLKSLLGSSSVAAGNSTAALVKPVAKALLALNGTRRGEL